jgi:hypothetical protein
MLLRPNPLDSRTEISTAEIEKRISGAKHNLWSPGSRVRRAEMRQGTRESSEWTRPVAFGRPETGSLTTDTMTREAVRADAFRPTYL